MTRDEFKKNLDIYGGDLSRWPREDIKPAYALVRADAAAEALLAEAEKLDAVLRLYTPAREKVSLAEKILRAAHGAAQNDDMPYTPPPILPLYARAGGMLMAALIGFGVSVYTVHVSPANSPLYAQEQAIHDGDADIYQF